MPYVISLTGHLPLERERSKATSGSELNLKFRLLEKRPFLMQQIVTTGYNDENLGGICLGKSVIIWLEWSWTCFLLCVCLALLVAHPPFLLTSSLSFVKHRQLNKSHASSIYFREDCPNPSIGDQIVNHPPSHQGDLKSLAGDWLRDERVTPLCSMRSTLMASGRVPLFLRKNSGDKCCQAWCGCLNQLFPSWDYEGSQTEGKEETAEMTTGKEFKNFGLRWDVVHYVNETRACLTSGLHVT